MCINGVFLILSIFFTITNSSSAAARTPPQSTDQTITFLMSNILAGSPISSAVPMTTGAGSPPSAGFLPAGNYGHPSAAAATFAVLRHGESTSSSSWVRILASWRALEVGMVTEIDEELVGDVLGFGQSTPMGKVQGIYVTSRESNISHVVTMKVSFAGDDSSLRFFGMVRTEEAESQIAVVGGDGKYGDANGYAVMKGVAPDGGIRGRERGSFNKFLSVAVHLR